MRFAGEPAGTPTPWGVVVTVKGHGALLAHRIVWKMLHGRDPDEVDHVDCDPLNNRPGNLRGATRAQNLRNRRMKPGRSGLCGVSRRGRRWIATISIGGRPRRLGSIEDPQAAHAAWRRAVRTHCGAFGRVD